MDGSGDDGDFNAQFGLRKKHSWGAADPAIILRNFKIHMPIIE
jgi:hypothetical protein